MFFIADVIHNQVHFHVGYFIGLIGIPLLLYGLNKQKKNKIRLAELEQELGL